MTPKKIISILYFFFIACNAFAQSSTELLTQAEKAYENLNYSKAVELYENYFSKYSNNDISTIQAKIKLGSAYKASKNYKEAERVFADIIRNYEIHLSNHPEVYKLYAQILTGNGKYSEANIYWKKYDQLNSDDKLGEAFIKLNNNREALQKNTDSYKIEYLGINSSVAEFSPAYYKNGLVFVSGKTNNPFIKRVFSWDNSNFLDLYFLENIKKLENEQDSPQGISSGNTDKTKTSTSNQSTSFTANDNLLVSHKEKASDKYQEKASIVTVPFSKKINTKYHEGPCSFFHDGSKIIFTRNAGTNHQGLNRLKLFSADFENNSWTKIKELAFNSDEYSCGHPTLSKDDKVMYFVSDMPGGYGGTDIWMTKNINGEWSKPQNLGGIINTKGNEMFPFIDADGNLYFSSDGHAGLGDLDIFYIEMNAQTGVINGKVRNLGYPFNTNRDDFGIITDAERKKGFFSSNRKRGGNDDDIYKFTREGTLFACRDLELLVLDENTKQALPNVNIRIQPSASNSKSIFKTNIDGICKICLEADREFKLVFQLDKFETYTTTYSNKEDSDYEVSSNKILLKKKNIEPIPAQTNPAKPLVSINNSQSTSSIFRGIVSSGTDGSFISEAKLTFTNQCNKEIQEGFSDKSGYYEFKRDLNCDYILETYKNGYGTIKQLIEKSTIIPKIEKKTNPSKPIVNSLFDTKLYKIDDVIRLDNIYYENIEYKLNPNTIREIEKIAGILQKNSRLIIEIRSHTDSRGDAKENMALSQKRAEEIQNYLLKFGIDKSRIKAIGKGESEPLNSCSDGVQCTELEYQRNRRTEFKIISIEKKRQT